MRSLTFILCVALSGISSAEASAQPAASRACADCPGDSDSGTCPPTCHDCVCSIGARTTATPLMLLAAPGLMPIGDVLPARGEPPVLPREPSLDGVFHPPKL